MSIEQTAAVILAGGRSLRMGADKALLRQHPGGPTLLEIVVSRLSEAGLPPALLVAGTPDKYSWLNIPTVTDEIPGAGTLGGILTALVYSRAPRTFIVACDMPLLNPALLHFMALLPLTADALVPRWSGENGSLQLEPLHAIYTPRCIEPIRRRLAAGNLRVTDALNELNVQYIEEAELRCLDPHLESFRNLNTPEEWASLFQ